MIAVTIHYIAMVAPNDDDTGARVAFPKAKHTLRIWRNGTPHGSGRNIRLQITRGGAEVKPRTRGLPMGGRVMSIAAAAGGGPYRLQSTADLLKGAAQAVLELHGGSFLGRPPQSVSRYRDTFWDIGGDSRQLTDTVKWTSDPVGDDTYTLIVDGTSTPLADGDQLEFANHDAAHKEFEDGDGDGLVEITDTDELYKLVHPSPVTRPRPVHAVLPAPIDSPMGKPPEGPAGGDLPLCPVGEP